MFEKGEAAHEEVFTLVVGNNEPQDFVEWVCEWVAVFNDGLEAWMIDHGQLTGNIVRPTDSSVDCEFFNAWNTADKRPARYVRTYVGSSWSLEIGC